MPKYKITFFQPTYFVEAENENLAIEIANENYDTSMSLNNVDDLQPFITLASFDEIKKHFN